jgi:hypothetical protein
MYHGGNKIAALVLKRKGKSAANAGTWPVHMDMDCWLNLFGVEDYGLSSSGGVMTMNLELLTTILKLRTDWRTT